MITTRQIHTVFIHCSASDKAIHNNVDTIRRWHLARGWVDIGYHFVITKDGHVHLGRPLKNTPAAQFRHNGGTVAVCLTGKSEFSWSQLLALNTLCDRLQTLSPSELRFRGHCEVSSKTCPVFNYRNVLKLDSGGKRAVRHWTGPMLWERE